MRCFPLLVEEIEIPYWITKDSFFRYFDQDDFRCREVIDVSQAYLSDWFYKIGDKLYFYLPTITFIFGKTQFISGRHRTALLLPHLEELPIGIKRNIFQDNSLLNYFDKRPLNLNESIELPDFPIREIDFFKRN